MFRTFLILFGILFILTTIPSVKADGMVIDPLIRPIMENSQLAAIHYEQGRENLLLVIETDEIHSEKAAWIVPIPAPHNKVILNIMPDFPMYSGYEVVSSVKRKFNDLMYTVRLTQLYPILFPRRYAPILLYGYYTKAIRDEYEGITVHELSLIHI